MSSLIADRAERFGDSTAIFSEEGDLSWTDLVTRAERVSGFLGAIGLAPGDRVATMLPSTTDYVAAWHGIMWRNGVDVPINNEYKGAFLEHILRDSGRWQSSSTPAGSSASPTSAWATSSTSWWWASSTPTYLQG